MYTKMSGFQFKGYQCFLENKARQLNISGKLKFGLLVAQYESSSKMRKKSLAYIFNTLV